MVELIEGLPDTVVGFEAKGKVTAEDYSDVVVPAIDAVREKHGKVRCLMVIGDEYDGFTLGAAWDDMKLGVHHPRAYERVALVTDKDWVRHGISVFGWMVPGEVKVFGTAERGDATAWVGA